MLAGVGTAQDELLVLDATGRAVLRYQYVVPPVSPLATWTLAVSTPWC